MREVIARLVDGSLFHEFKPDYGNTLVCGYAYLWGFKVGILGNNGVLFSESADKATQFMQLCDRDGVPLLFLHNITGFMIGRDYEHRGITKDGAKMLMVQANVTVPKLALITHASNGAGHYAMNSMAWDPRFLFSWPNARVSVMGGEQAAKTLAQVKLAALKREGKVPGPDEVAAIMRQTAAEYDAKSDAYYATSELWDDGILDPVDTRNALGIALVGRAQPIRSSRAATACCESEATIRYVPYAIRNRKIQHERHDTSAARVQPRSALPRDPRAGRPFRAQGIASAAAEDGRRGMVAGAPVPASRRERLPRRHGARGAGRRGPRPFRAGAGRAGLRALERERDL